MTLKNIFKNLNSFNDTSTSSLSHPVIIPNLIPSMTFKTFLDINLYLINRMSYYI